jgi:hypothetical protein
MVYGQTLERSSPKIWEPWMPDFTSLFDSSVVPAEEAVVVAVPVQAEAVGVVVVVVAVVVGAGKKLSRASAT